MSLVPLPELFFWTPSRFGFIPRPFVISFRSGRENSERFNLKEVTAARAEGKDKYIKSANGVFCLWYFLYFLQVALANQNYTSHEFPGGQSICMRNSLHLPHVQRLGSEQRKHISSVLGISQLRADLNVNTSMAVMAII